MYEIGMTVLNDGKYAKILDIVDNQGLLVEYSDGVRESLFGDEMENLQIVNYSDELILDALLESDLSDTSIEVTDANFEVIERGVNDSIFGILGNTALLVAEQKKMLQNAKTPLALQNALKALAVTSANLVSAGTGMLSWMGNKLNRKDSSSEIEE